MNRKELIKCLNEQQGVLFNPKSNTKELRSTLVNFLSSKHPINDFVEKLSLDELKVIWKHFNLKGHFQNRKRNKEQIAKFFLKTFPLNPFETLKSF